MLYENNLVPIYRLTHKTCHITGIAVFVVTISVLYLTCDIVGFHAVCSTCCTRVHNTKTQTSFCRVNFNSRYLNVCIVYARSQATAEVEPIFCLLQ